MNSRSAGRLLAALKPMPMAMPYRFQPSSRQLARPFSQTCFRRSDAPSGTPPPPSASEAKSEEATPESSSSTSEPSSSTPTAAAAAAPETPAATTTDTPRVNSMAQLSSLFDNSNKSAAPTGPTAGPSVSGTPVNLSQRIMNKALNHNNDSILGSEVDGSPSESPYGPAHEPFHFHVKSHRRNCHITVTKPDRGAILSMSTGNIGFRKAKRGSYDAAYQLAAYVIDKLHQGNWHRRIGALEVVLSGFGQGREAVTKVLMGSEGRMLRSSIVKVSDATKLKFGGTRSKRPRRL